MEPKPIFYNIGVILILQRMASRRVQVQLQELEHLSKIRKFDELWWELQINQLWKMEVRLPANYPALPPQVVVTNGEIREQINVPQLLGRDWLPSIKIKEILNQLREKYYLKELPPIEEPKHQMTALTESNTKGNLVSSINLLDRIYCIRFSEGNCTLIKADQKQEKLRLEWKPSCGLSNCGNCCYLNTVVQLLYRCGGIRELLVAISWPEPFLSALSDTLWEMSGQRVFAPKQLAVETERQFSEPMSQEDSSHYLNFILNRMNDCCPNLFQQIIGITQTDCLKCNSCNHTQYQKSEEVWVIEMHPTAKESKLEALWEKYTRYQLLDSQCSKCNSKKQTGTIKLEKKPQFLVFHLNWNNQKSRTNEIFMPEVFKPDGCQYSLLGFAVHVGYSGRGGHYYANIRDPQGNWLEYNDSSARKISKKCNDFSSNRERPILVIYESAIQNREIFVDIELRETRRKKQYPIDQIYRHHHDDQNPQISRKNKKKEKQQKQLTTKYVKQKIQPQDLEKQQRQSSHSKQKKEEYRESDIKNLNNVSVKHNLEEPQILSEVPKLTGKQQGSQKQWIGKPLQKKPDTSESEKMSNQQIQNMKTTKIQSSMEIKIKEKLMKGKDNNGKTTTGTQKESKKSKKKRRSFIPCCNASQDED